MLKAMSTVSGIVDASGSAGSAIGQLFVPLVQNHLGWAYVFYLFIIMVRSFTFIFLSASSKLQNALGTACLFRRFILDIRDIYNKHRGRLRSEYEEINGAVEASHTTATENNDRLHQS